MKKKHLTLSLCALLLLTASCTRDFSTDPDGVHYSKDSKLRRIVMYPTLESTTAMYIDEYEYNADQVAQISSFDVYHDTINHYETFHYQNGLLAYKLDIYRNSKSPTGFLLLDSTTYEYENDLLVKETSYFPQAHYNDHIEYTYSGDKLEKMTKYHRDELESYITYEYSNGKIAKEHQHYTPGEIFHTTLYFYEKELLTRKELYYTNGGLFRIINYTYDKYGHLIIEQSQELSMASSMSSFVLRYEYE